MRLNRFILTGPGYLRINRAGRFMLIPSIAVLLSAVSKWTPPHAIASAMIGVQFAGVSLLSRKWSRERGIWMLLWVFGAMIAFCAWGATNGITHDLMRDSKAFWPEGVDLFVADTLSVLSLWMIWTASVWNWRWFHRKDGETSQTPPPEPSPVPAWPHRPLPSLSTQARVPMVRNADSFALSRQD